MTDGLEGLPLLDGCAEAERSALAEAFECLWLEPGTSLFREGEPGDALYWLLDGQVQLRCSAASATSERGPGSSLGALSLVVDGPREVTVETLSQCRVLRLSRPAFAALVECAPRAACRLLEEILREQAGCERSAGRALLRVQLDPPAGSD